MARSVFTPDAGIDVNDLCMKTSHMAVSIVPKQFAEPGEFGWSGAVKRSLRAGHEVLIQEYCDSLQDECCSIEVKLNGEGLGVKFWPGEQVARFIFWPPRDQ
jgi:hypothetical protein